MRFSLSAKRYLKRHALVPKRSPTDLGSAASPVAGGRLFRQVPLAVRADRGSRDLMRFPRHSSAVDSGMVERQETQIVQSWLTLDDILP